MTLTELADRAEAVDTAVPTKAQFECGRFDDGSGPMIKIGYDATSENLGGHIIIDEYTITFDHRCAEEVIAAIRYCAAALRAMEQLT